MKSYSILGTATLFAAAALGPAFAQTTQSPPDQTTQNTQTTSQPSTPATDTTQNTAASNSTTGQNGTYATGKPLEQQSKEGFWGHMNPMARKKWVKRQVDPIRDRANELDELQSKNANDIRDVDTRATAGINKAMTAANTADQHASDAANRANQANQLASSADSRTTTLNGTVQNLDQYSKVSSEELPFRGGRTALTKSQKDTLDTMASSLGKEKGYIVEVQGYSRSGVARSQAMADSVVRYLVTDQNVPIYRIYRTGMGHVKANAEAADNNGEKPLTNGVRITVLHNSLASMGESGNSQTAPATGATTPNGAYSNTTGTANPPAGNNGTAPPQ